MLSFVQILVTVAVILALFPRVRQKVVDAVGRTFAVLFAFALVFLAVVVLTQ
ncbi:MAG: hypothetical protein GVY13_17005 [Alphaproteobacteria bacterium]|jgi:Ca2+/Na+ antiporter|nr:hypothetical protein [Alphaproteobacteria bacterium]